MRAFFVGEKVIISNPLAFGIIHLSYLPLCSLRSLWLNHADATVNDISCSPSKLPTLSPDAFANLGK
jgi:hypothetical protein